jgi:hypothetical protein
MHSNICETASDELWEESCGLVDCNADVLRIVGHWCTASPWKGRVAHIYSHELYYAYITLIYGH